MIGTLYLCGAGNPEGVRLARRLNDVSQRWERILLLDDDPDRQGERHVGIPVVGGFDLLASVDPEEAEVVNLVSRTTAARKAAGRRIAAHGIPRAGLVSPDVDLLGVEAAPDLIAYQNATIGPEVGLGAGSVVFMGAAVGHECTVGQGCIIAANAVLNARVVLGDGVYVGTNATVLPEVEVGEEAVIGAGVVVLDDVPAGATVIGPGCHVMRPERTPSIPSTPGNRETERRLAALWSEVLGVPRVSLDENFFELGGTSLLALRLAAKVESELGRAVSVVEVFRSPTVRALAARLAPSGSGGGWSEPARQRAELRRQARGGS